MASFNSERIYLECLNFLLQEAKQFNTSDGCFVYNFPDKETAEKLSAQLARIGIVGGSGRQKYVAQHMIGNPDFGIVLTADNLYQISVEITKFVRLDRTESGVLSSRLSGLLDGKTIGYYRNSHHSLHNLAKALDQFAETGNVDVEIDATSSQGMGSWTQPTTIKLKFEWALNHEIHGGILQTIAAMEKASMEVEIVFLLKEIINFLKE